MPELGPLGSVRGALRNESPYRDQLFRWVESADAILDSVKRFYLRAVGETAQTHPWPQTSESEH